LNSSETTTTLNEANANIRSMSNTLVKPRMSGASCTREPDRVHLGASGLETVPATARFRWDAVALSADDGLLMPAAAGPRSRAGLASNA